MTVFTTDETCSGERPSDFRVKTVSLIVTGFATIIAFASHLLGFRAVAGKVAISATATEHVQS